MLVLALIRCVRDVVLARFGLFCPVLPTGRLILVETVAIVGDERASSA